MMLRRGTTVLSVRFRALDWGSGGPLQCGALAGKGVPALALGGNEAACADPRTILVRLCSFRLRSHPGGLTAPEGTYLT